MNIIIKQVSELQEAPLNVRKHSQKQIEEYAKSIKMFGQIKPIVCDEDGVIWCGNGLYEALVYAGIETAECYVYTGLTENQKKKLMLADNKIYELGMTSMPMFDEIIQSLDGDFGIPGWDDDLLNVLVGTEKDISEAVQEYGTTEVVEGSSVTNEHIDGGSVSPQTGYAPVVRDEQTGEIKRPSEGPSEAERPFVICPKCGEKIWL